MANFEKDLRKLVEKLDDNPYAQAMYAALCNMQWKHTDGKIYSCSWRYAGGLVAGLRCEGENYLDFYCSGIDGISEGEVTEEIENDLGNLGWTKLPYGDERWE